MKSGAEVRAEMPAVNFSAAAIREHLRQLCQAQPFRTSSRSIRFLTYVVEETLSGHKENLKERSIGMAVFNRPADYDSESDPVVRQAAAEVRKRLLQFYAGPGTHHRLRIDIPHGSYAACFHNLELPSGTVPPKPNSRNQWAWKLLGVAALAVAATCTRTFRALYQHSLLEMFWEPVLSDPSPVLLCIGKGSGFRNDRPVTTTSRNFGTSDQQVTTAMLEHDLNVHAVDALVLARVSAFLAQKRKPLLLRYVNQVSFAELRESPALMIGAFNNNWSLALTGELRYRFRDSDNGRDEWIEDTMHPGVRNWALTNIPADGNIPEDYGIVTRVLNPSTGRMLVVLAGLTYHATMAAGEFVTNPQSLESARALLPKNWQSKNLEIVLATKITANSNGPPSVIAAQVW